jgi:hypothetical protein
MRLFASMAVALVLASSGVTAQPPKPTPGPEHKRLAAFAGQWNFEGEAKESPLGPAGKLSGSDTCEWFAGGFQLVCRSKGSGPRGPMTGMAVMSYDPARKAYTYYAMSSLGDNIFVRGQVQGKVWTWTDEATMEGKKVKFVATITEDSPTSNSFKLEVSVDGGPMTVVETGKSTKKTS